MVFVGDISKPGGAPPRGKHLPKPNGLSHHGHHDWIWGVGCSKHPVWWVRLGGKMLGTY